jgi:hypothetical protein
VTEKEKQIVQQLIDVAREILTPQFAQDIAESYLVRLEEAIDAAEEIAK